MLYTFGGCVNWRRQLTNVVLFDRYDGLISVVIILAYECYTSYLFRELRTLYSPTHLGENPVWIPEEASADEEDWLESRVRELGRGTSPTGGGVWGRGCRPSPEKKWVFLSWNGVFWWTAVYFVRPLASHCKARNVVLEILKHDKSGWHICISDSVSPSPNCGGLVAPPFRGDLRPWSV